MTLWVRWKKPVKLLVTIEPEEVEDAQDIENHTADKYIRGEILLNSLIALNCKFFRVAQY